MPTIVYTKTYYTGVRRQAAFATYMCSNCHAIQVMPIGITATSSEYTDSGVKIDTESSVDAYLNASGAMVAFLASFRAGFPAAALYSNCILTMDNHQYNIVTNPMPCLKCNGIETKESFEEMEKKFTPALYEKPEDAISKAESKFRHDMHIIDIKRDVPELVKKSTDLAIQAANSNKLLLDELTGISNEEQDKLAASRDALLEEKKKLGLFDRKNKKRLNDEIASIEQKLSVVIEETNKHRFEISNKMALNDAILEEHQPIAFGYNPEIQIIHHGNYHCCYMQVNPIPATLTENS